MKKIISLVLVLSMIFSLSVSMNLMQVNAALDDGMADFDTGVVPELIGTPTSEASYLYNYVEDGYTIQGRVSHPAHNWEIEKDALGKKGYSILGTGKKGVAATTDKQNDPCLNAYVTFDNPAKLESTDEYYTLEFDVALTGNNNRFEVIATTDNGASLLLLTGVGNGKNISSDALRITDSIYFAYQSSWHKFKLVLKSADVTAKDGDANDAVAEDTHQYWLYANGNLVKSGTTSIKKRNDTNSLNSFAAITKLDIRAYGITDQDATTKLHTTKESDWSIRLDNIATYVTNSLPVTDWEGSIDFDTLTDSTDIAAINSELWDEQVGYFLSGKAYGETYTYVRSSKKGLASVEGGVFGKDATDKAISVSLDGTQTDGTHFFQITQAGQGYNQMQRMGKGDFFEFQTYMAWEDNAYLPGVQGFYSNTASNDGKGSMLLNLTPSSGAVYVFGTYIPNLKVTSKTWYKFNIVVHAGDINAVDDADKNWFNFYVNDRLVAEKVVFTPTIRGGTQPTFLGVDQFWFQVGAGSAQANPDQTSGKTYYDDIKIKYTTTPSDVLEPVYIGTTDEYGKLYFGEGATTIPGTDNYIDQRVTLDSDKWFTSDGSVMTIKNSSVGVNNYYSITGNGRKLFGNLKNSNSVLAGTKVFSDTTEPNKEFNYALKDFTTHSVGSYIAGKDFDDYSFRIDSVNVYDNWVKVLEDDGVTPTSAEYQSNPENWIDKADVPEEQKDLYKFRDSYNPFVQMFPGTHFSNGVKEDAPWSVAFSMYTSGKYNSADFQVISSDKISQNIITLDQVHGNVVSVFGTIIEDEKGNPLKYNDNQWHDVVINVYPKANVIDVILDGKVVYSGEDTFPWENLARVKFQHAFGAVPKAEARTGTLAIDDIYFYGGSRYEAANIEIAADGAFDDKYIDGGIITVTSAANAGDLSDITEVNGKSIIKEVYQGNDFGTTVGDDITSGNILLVKSSDCRQIRYYYLADVEEKPEVEFTSVPEYILEETNLLTAEIVTNTVIKGNIFAASYEDVGTAKQMLKCTSGSLEDAEYRYDGKALSVKVPALYLGVGDSVTSVKLIVLNNKAFPICATELTEQ